MLTKLVQWLLLAGFIVSLWLGILMERLGGGKLNKAYPLLVMVWPVILVAIFGIYSVLIIAKRVFDFNDCQAAAEELKSQIAESKADLRKKGLDVDSL